MIWSLQRERTYGKKKKNENGLMPLTNNTKAKRQHSSALDILREAKFQSVIYQAKP